MVNIASDTRAAERDHHNLSSQLPQLVSFPLIMAAGVSYWTIASVIVGAVAFIPFIMGFFGGNKFNVQGKVSSSPTKPPRISTDIGDQQTLVLTGASEGMGKSVAKQLAAKGANIVIVSRGVAKLEGALAEIKVGSLHPKRKLKLTVLSGCSI